MIKRIITAVVLLPLLLVVVLVLPKICTGILFGLMAAIAAYELLCGTKLIKHSRLLIYAGIMALLTGLYSSLGIHPGVEKLTVLAFFCLLAGELLLSHAKLPFYEVALTFAAGLIIPYLLCAVVRLHSWDNGRYLILLPFVIAFLSDTGAYFAGMAFGSHKLAPIISPKKTVEGLVGGVLGAIIGVFIYALVLQLAFGFHAHYWYTLIYGLLGSLGAVLGDLCFSAIKRQTGIKDYSQLIPGHGGILDRFDSVIVVAPLTEALMLLIPLVVK